MDAVEAVRVQGLARLFSPVVKDTIMSANKVISSIGQGKGIGQQARVPAKSSDQCSDTA